MTQLADGSNIPDGFKELKISGLKLYSNGKDVVICGEPPEEKDDPDSTAHNCDDMGCNWEHVLLTFENKNKANCNGIYLDWMMNHN
jgi:hypothetical protein